MKRAHLVLFALLFSVVACARILGIKPASETKAFPHRAHTEKGINCRQCHEGVASSTNTGGIHIPSSASCVTAACHAKPHDARACDGCHGQLYVRESVSASLANLKFDHKSHVSRERGQCVGCHAAVANDSDHVRPEMVTCLSCHEHEDDFATQNCDRCHKDLRGEHVMPSSHVVHEGDWLREHGAKAASSRELCSTCHAERVCAGCHGKTVAALPERQFFDDPLRAGVHRAGFRSRHSNEARSQPGLCTTCHSNGTFCQSCHDASGVSPAGMGKSPHPPGWLGLRGERNDHGAAAWRDPSECASCHSGGGEQLCVGCHKVGGIGGSIHRPGWTSTKRKSEVPCVQCHGGP
jgi:hypothetical protein